MRSAAAALVAACALALAACGPAGSSSGSFEGERKAVAESIDSLQKATTDRGSASEICLNLLTRELAARLSQGGTSCGQEIKQAIADSDLFDLQVTDVQVRGTTATARVQSNGGGETRTATMQLVKQGGDWRVNGIAAA